MGKIPFFGESGIETRKGGGGGCSVFSGLNWIRDFLFLSCSYWGWLVRDSYCLEVMRTVRVNHLVVAKFLVLPGNELSKWLLRAMLKLLRMTFCLGACPVDGTGLITLSVITNVGTPSTRGAEIRSFSALPAEGGQGL